MASKKPPLGSGARFSALSQALASRPGVQNPDALAASIGRQKYGKEHFQAIAARARSRKHHGRHVSRQAAQLASRGAHETNQPVQP